MGEYDAGYEHYIDGLHREIEKLREQLEGIVGRSFRTADKMSCLEAENAKLRELCKDIYDETVSGCYGCLSLEHVKHPSKCDNGICEYKRIVDRIRELGIEVDG